MTNKKNHIVLPHEADVHSKAAMNGGAIDAKEDPISDRSPSGVLGIAIKTHLVLGLRFEFLEHGVLVSQAVGRHVKIPLQELRHRERDRERRNGFSKRQCVIANTSSPEIFTGSPNKTKRDFLCFA
uniref:ADP-ribosylation factor GTPase-activating protein AGD10 n=1 Tax=Rhizophora mucronata TaxID=61149 RepID=A0A2P2LQ79_RHIMU